MPSPFSGMDPYLEGYLWPDVHNALANKIRQQLTLKLRPCYAARLEVYVVEDSFPESEIGILYPNVELMQLRQQQQEANTASTNASTRSESVIVTPAPLTLPILQPVPVWLANVEIRDTAQNILVTCIEILSPVNKREPGLTVYRRKCQCLYQGEIHLVELDLLRRGTRPFAHPQMLNVSYMIALSRARFGVIDAWPLTLQNTLPNIPVPLRTPDPDVILDLPTAIREIYDEAAYDLSINYRESPPPPALSEAEKQWLETLLSS